MPIAGAATGPRGGQTRPGRRRRPLAIGRGVLRRRRLADRDGRVSAYPERTCAIAWIGADIGISDGTIAFVQVDRDAGAVEVEAGCRLRDLHDILRTEYDLAFSSLGSISDQTVAGAVLTGTHGTGLAYGLLAESVSDPSSYPCAYRDL